MDSYVFSDNTLLILIVLSWIVFISGIGIVCFQFSRRKEQSLSSKILAFSGILFVSVFLLRFATGTFVNQLIMHNKADEQLLGILEYAVSMHWLETVARSLVQTLRTFAVDEDYAIYAVVAERMGESVLSAHWILPVLYRIHAGVVTVLAPVAGGAIIFDILTRIFPKMKLRFMPFWREFYVFSELNDSSLALAQSIKEDFSNSKANRRKQIKKLKKGSPLSKELFIAFPEDNSNPEKPIKRKRVTIKRKKKPVIVFTDAYIDRENEAISERIASAKSMGAICLTEDIFHIRIRGFVRRLFGTKLNYLLMDEKEDNNLHTLSMLSEHKKGKRLLHSSVYLFSNSSSANDLARCVNNKLKKVYGENNKKLPLIRVIEGYRNLVYNLLRDVPLYEPLIGRKPVDNKTEKDLNVTIIGSGVIGMQMFLATYWMGQMLGVKLHINVVSQESESTFKDRVNLINADILKTEASKADPELLSVYSASHKKADPYFKLRYVETDVMTGTLYEALSKKFDNESFALCDSDYFVVAIGSDENNIFVANKIKQFIGRDLICDTTNRRAIINYVVYDRDVCSTLNSVQDNPNIYMNAFGNFRDVYNYENVFMSKSYGTAVELNATYTRKAFADKKYDKADMNKLLNDEYNYWSSIARGIHIPYKYFSAGVVTKSSIFDKTEVVTEDSKVFNDYLRKICIELSSKKDNLPSEKDREELYYKLCWLEHRRWNAFIRTGGFTTPTKEQVDTYAYREPNKAKEISLRLHPCLVECDDKPPKLPAAKVRTATIASDVKLDASEITRNDYDRLDAVSLYLHILAKERLNENCCIYKAYDSPYELNAEDKSIKIQ